MRGFGYRFWIFLAGQATSAIGSWATLVAIWGFAAYSFDAGTRELALIGLAWLVPPAVIGPFAGLPIDRFGPRPVLVAGKALGAVASVALVFADSFGLLVLFSIGHGVAYAFVQPALDAIPPRAISDDRLASANALVRTSVDLAIVLGPVAAAGSIALWGFTGAFVFDAVTYGIGVVSAYAISIRSDHIADSAADEARVKDTWRDVLSGFKVVLRNPSLRLTVLLTGSVYFLYGTALLLEPIYVRDVLGEPVQTFAYLQTAFGVCLVAGGLLVARAGERMVSFGVLALAVLGSGIGAIAYLSTDSIVVAYLGVMGWGAVTALFAGPSRTLLQRHAPPGTQGRVLALDHTVEGIGHLAAMPVVALLAALAGVQAAAICIGLVVASVGGIHVVRSRRNDAGIADVELATSGEAGG